MNRVVRYGMAFILIISLRNVRAAEHGTVTVASKNDAEQQAQQLAQAWNYARALQRVRMVIRHLNPQPVEPPVLSQKPTISNPTTK